MRSLCPATAEHHFTAPWITAEDAPGHDPAVLRLQKEFVLPTVPAHFLVHVSADNHFLLRVNRQPIGEGAAIGDVQHWRYQTYDLAPALHTRAATGWQPRCGTLIQPTLGGLLLFAHRSGLRVAMHLADDRLKVHRSAPSRGKQRRCCFRPGDVADDACSKFECRIARFRRV